MIKLSKIRKLPNGKYRVLSEKGKNLGTYPSLSAAKTRLQQVEYFKHRKSELYRIANDLEEIHVPTYSETIRNLRKKYPEKVHQFLVQFKQAFEEAETEDLDQLEQTALLQALQWLKSHA